MMNTKESMDPIRNITIRKHIAVIGTSKDFQLELNEISGRHGQPLLDLRLFSIEGHIPRHGLNLRKENIILLRDELIKYTNIEADTEEEPKTEQE